MIYTEQEARARKCPLKVDGPNCLASSCMAWRAIDKYVGYCGMAGVPTEHDIRETLRKPRR
jgi:hypothetical protein